MLEKLKLWFLGKFFISLIALGSATRRRRMSHNSAVAGKGKIRIVDNPKFPATDFFEPGREFPCQLRHANVAYMDDAMNVARSATLKFSLSEFNSPLDIQMNTGKHAFFWNARSFLQFAFWRHESGGIEYEKYYRTYPQGRKAAASAFRRNPSSYGQLFYHSQTPFGWKSSDGVDHYVKYRLVPEDGQESARPADDLPIEAFNDYTWATKLADQRVLDGEERNINYLKNEYVERVGRGPVKYTLQLQLHAVSDSDDIEVRNPHRYWNEETHPWMDLATVEIDEILSYEEQSKLTFEITNHPPTISILSATDMDDYNSLNYMRVQSIWAIRVRRFLQKIFGPPKQWPDDSPHNLNPKGM